MSVDVKLIDKQTYEEKMDALILAVSGVSANSGSHATFSSYEQLQQLIRDGLGAKIFPVGTQVKTERETTLLISIGDSTGITGATIDEDTFVNAIGDAFEGVYEAHFDGSVWKKEDETPIRLDDYGISTTGTPVEGDHLVITETADTLIWDVLDHNKHTFQNPALTKGVVLGMHDVFTYGTIPFCPAQLLYFAKNGLAAGKYKFTLVNGAYGGGTGQDATYMFTLTQAIPSGGGFRHSTIGVYQSSYSTSQITGGTITTYGAMSNCARATVESGIAVSIYDNSEATDLGTFSAENHSYASETNNSTERNAYGSNRWKTSLFRQWLNSTARAWKSGDTKPSQWYAPQSDFDMPPSETVLKLAGFLHGFGTHLLDLIQPVEIKTALTNFDKASSGEYDTTYDKIWLQSMTELGLGQNNSVSEGSTFAYWLTRNTNADRIKRQGGTARWWFLRSPYPSYAYLVRCIDGGGGLGSISAYYTYGCVPACVLG